MDKENRTVLVIDDEQDACWLVRHILEEKNYPVLTATSGEEGVRVFESNLTQLGLVFLDLKLPDVDGLKICKRMKEKQPDLPVVIMTAYGTDSAREQAKAMNVHEFIDKPLKVEVILNTVKEILGEAPSGGGANADEMRRLLEEVSRDIISSETPDKNKAKEFAIQLKAICGASPDWLNEEIQTRTLLIIVALEDLSEPEAEEKSLNCIKGELPALQKELEGVINPPAEMTPEKPQEKEVKTEPVAEEKPEKQEAEAEKPPKESTASAEAPSAEVEEPPAGIKKSLAGVKGLLAKAKKSSAGKGSPVKVKEPPAKDREQPAGDKKAPPVDIKFIFSLVIILLVGFSFYRGKTSFSKANGLKNAGSFISAIEWYGKSLGAMPLNKKAKKGLCDVKSQLAASFQSDAQKKLEMSKAALEKEKVIACAGEEVSVLKKALKEKEGALKAAREDNKKLQKELALTSAKVKKAEEAKAKTALELKEACAKFTELKQAQETLHSEKSQWAEEKSNLLSQVSKLREENKKLEEGFSAPELPTEKEIKEKEKAAEAAREKKEAAAESARQKKEAAEKSARERERKKAQRTRRLREESLPDPYTPSAVPADKYEINRNMAFVIGLAKKGKYDDAASKLAEMLMLDPGNDEARFLFNTIVNATEETSAKRLKEKLPPPLISAALNYIALRKYKEAEKELNRYLTQHPSDALAGGLLIKVRMLNGQS